MILTDSENKSACAIRSNSMSDSNQINVGDLPNEKHKEQRSLNNFNSSVPPWRFAHGLGLEGLALAFRHWTFDLAKVGSGEPMLFSYRTRIPTSQPVKTTERT
jgi:hypothetical protein